MATAEGQLTSTLCSGKWSGKKQSHAESVACEAKFQLVADGVPESDITVSGIPSAFRISFYSKWQDHAAVSGRSACIVLIGSHPGHVERAPEPHEAREPHTIPQRDGLSAMLPYHHIQKLHSVRARYAYGNISFFLCFCIQALKQDASLHEGFLDCHRPVIVQMSTGRSQVTKCYANYSTLHDERHDSSQSLPGAEERAEHFQELDEDGAPNRIKLNQICRSSYFFRGRTSFDFP